jgi:hypothetical protein
MPLKATARSAAPLEFTPNYTVTAVEAAAVPRWMLIHCKSGIKPLIDLCY